MEQNIFTSQNLKLYKTLKEISAVCFHEIKFSGNIVMLDKDYEEDNVYNSNQIAEISLAWNKLYDEYFEKTDDTKFKKDLKHKKSSLELLLEINLLKSILKILEGLKENEKYAPKELILKTESSIKNELKRISTKIKFDTLKPLKENITNVKNYVDGLQTRYEIKFKEDLVVEEKDIIEYYQMTIEIARVLKVDHIPDHINMLQYIAYLKTYRKAVKNAKQQHQRRQTGKGAR